MSIQNSGLPNSVDLQLDVFNNIAGNAPLSIEDSTSFGTTINAYDVVTSIVLRTDSTADERATLSVVEQVLVPEPAGILGLALGILLGLSRLMGRRRSG
jgi:hypothetical protein